MIFNSIRIIIWILISILIFIIIKMSKFKKKKLLFIVLLIISFVLVSLSVVFPLENVFYSFSTPEEIFKYTHDGQITDIVYGKDSCMIIYSENENQGGSYIIPKIGDKYKIPNYFNAKKIVHSFNSNGNFYIYKVYNSNDYYIIGTVITKENQIDIIGSNNIEIKKLFQDMGTGTNTVFLYSYLFDFSDEFYLLIDNQKIMLGQ